MHYYYIYLFYILCNRNFKFDTDMADFILKINSLINYVNCNIMYKGYSLTFVHIVAYIGTLNIHIIQTHNII